MTGPRCWSRTPRPRWPGSTTPTRTGRWPRCWRPCASCSACAPRRSGPSHTAGGSRRRRTAGPSPFHLGADGIALAGDGWGRPRVETAWRSGTLLGRAVVERLGGGLTSRDVQPCAHRRGPGRRRPAGRAAGRPGVARPRRDGPLPARRGGVGRARPGRAVVRPQSTAEVAAVVGSAPGTGGRWCHAGAGTGLSGGANAVDGCVLLCTERMSEIVEINTAERLAVVQPGVVNDDLRRVRGQGGTVVPAGPGQRALVDHRRQRGHQRRRPVLREVRGDPRLRAGAGGGDRGRRGGAGRAAHREGRGRLRPGRAAGRLRGHPGRDHRDHRAAAPAAQRPRRAPWSGSSTRWPRPATRWPG